MRVAVTVPGTGQTSSEAAAPLFLLGALGPVRHSAAAGATCVERCQRCPLYVCSRKNTRVRSNHKRYLPVAEEVIIDNTESKKRQGRSRVRWV